MPASFYFPLRVNRLLHTAPWVFLQCGTAQSNTKPIVFTYVPYNIQFVGLVVEKFANSFTSSNFDSGRSQFSRGLRRKSAVTRLLRLWVRTPLGAWMFFCCECCVLSGRGLCDGLITHSEESYRLWCVVVCDLETSWMRRPWPTGVVGGGGCCAKNKTKKKSILNVAPVLPLEALRVSWMESLSWSKIL